MKLLQLLKKIFTKISSKIILSRVQHLLGSVKHCVLVKSSLQNGALKELFSLLASDAFQDTPEDEESS